MCSGASGFVRSSASHRSSQDENFASAVFNCFHLDFGCVDITTGCKVTLDPVGYFPQFRLATSDYGVHYSADIHCGASQRGK